MTDFFPFIHKIKEDKKENDLEQLYLEIEPPLQYQEENKEDEPKIIVIEL